VEAAQEKELFVTALPVAPSDGESRLKEAGAVGEGFTVSVELFQ
jgi:hypothetical protein